MVVRFEDFHFAKEMQIEFTKTNNEDKQTSNLVANLGQGWMHQKSQNGAG